MKDVIIIAPFQEDGKTPNYPYDLLDEVRKNHDLYNEQRECKISLLFNRKWGAARPGKVPKTHNVIIPKGVTAALAEELQADVSKTVTPAAAPDSIPQPQDEMPIEHGDEIADAPGKSELFDAAKSAQGTI